jgi:hypothetical protein
VGREGRGNRVEPINRSGCNDAIGYSKRMRCIVRGCKREEEVSQRCFLFHHMIKGGLTVPRPMDGIFDPLDRVK